MVRYNLNGEIPSLRCLECGNSKNFDVMFKESYVEVTYRNGKEPEITEWTDSGRDFEATCHDCDSQDIQADDSFFV